MVDLWHKCASSRVLAHLDSLSEVTRVLGVLKWVGAHNHHKQCHATGPNISRLPALGKPEAAGILPQEMQA